MSDLTRHLDTAAAGDRKADDLLPLVYDELRKLAAAHMSAERPDHTLDATALVHEAFLRLRDCHSFESKSHFMRVAAETMRRILIDHARARTADKRGGQRRRLPLEELSHLVVIPDQILALEDALTRFATEEPRKAELVVLRFYFGMTTSEAAKMLDVSVPTAERWWSFARVWLFSELDGEKLANP